MLTVKFVKYGISASGRCFVESFSIQETESVNVRRGDDGRWFIRLSGDDPNVHISICARDTCSFNMARVMNAAGNIVETIQ
jgi:hypothetical protein